MPIRDNPRYNNPGIGRAAESIASLFTPPSGAEAAGWANANATNAKAGHLQWLFDNSQDATAAERAALIGAQTYGNTPEGFRASDATDRYGYDTSAAATRYGHDQTYAASTQNNQRDNARAVQTNVLDNQRATTVGLFGNDIAPGAVRRAVPEEFMAPLGLPGVAGARGDPKPLSTDEVLAQAILDQGPETAERYAADKFAPSETQVQGQERRRLAGGGLLTDQMLVDTIIGAESPVEVVRPDGRNGFMSPGAAVRIGAEPVPRTASTVINNGPNGVPFGEPEKGTVWARNPDGTVKLDDRGAPVAIPYQGGSVYRDQELASKAASGRDEFDSSKHSVVLDDIDRTLARIAENPTLTTGLGAQLTGQIGGSPAYDVRALTDTVRANLGFEQLQQMRDASPTGGALGQVTERELAFLQATLGNIETAQSQPQIEYNLRRLKNQFLDIVHGPDAGPPREDLTGGRAQDAGPEADPQEGDIAVNPSTGERLILRNGQWAPLT